ncbi:MAG TPA: cupin domain-containing protein [Micropepsaceae bacterium]|nr:cupin domain-containing protein [Micropepsaceae bacterium]
MNADEIIALLQLQPHPEGGHYREVFRDQAQANGRAHSTAIYFLLKAGEESRWHRVDAAECWHLYAGSALVLETTSAPRPEGAPEVTRIMRHTLGMDLAAGERPQLIVPARHWQRAWPTGAFTLVGCTVAPGFEFSGFEMA